VSVDSSDKNSDDSSSESSDDDVRNEDSNDSVQFVSPYLDTSKVTGSSKKKSGGLSRLINVKQSTIRKELKVTAVGSKQSQGIAHHEEMQPESAVIELRGSSGNDDDNDDDDEEDVVIVKSDVFGFKRK